MQQFWHRELHFEHSLPLRKKFPDLPLCVQVGADIGETQMKATLRKLSAVVVLAMLILLPATAHAQVLQNNSQSVALSYSVGESLTVTLNTPSITLTSSDQPITGTVNYTLAPSRTFVGYLFYFNTTTALTNGSSGSIPVANVAVGDSPCNSTLSAVQSAMGISSGVGTGLFAGAPSGQSSLCGSTNSGVTVQPTSVVGYNGTLAISTTIKLTSAPTAYGNYTGTLQLLAAAI
jgi:hypothetical protein